jgi:hypothetical protein
MKRFFFVLAILSACGAQPAPGERWAYRDADAECANTRVTVIDLRDGNVRYVVDGAQRLQTSPIEAFSRVLVLDEHQCPIRVP